VVRGDEHRAEARPRDGARRAADLHVFDAIDELAHVLLLSCFLLCLC